MNRLIALKLPGLLLVYSIQYFLLCFNLPGQFLFQRLGCIQFYIDGFLVIYDIRNLRIQLVCFLLRRLGHLFSILDLCQSLFGIHLSRILNDIISLQLAADLIHLLIISGPFPPQAFRGGFHLIHFPFQLLNRLFKFFNLPPPAKQVAGVLECASGHGASRINQFAFQGHDPQRLLVLLGNGRPMVDVIYHQRPAKQIV